MWVISWWLFLIFKKKNAIFSYYIHTNGILEVMKNWGSRSTLTRDFTNLLLSAALSKPVSVGLSQVVSTTIMKPVYLCNSSLIFWNLLNYRKISFQNWITEKHTQIWKLPITIIDKCLETF